MSGWGPSPPLQDAQVLPHKESSQGQEPHQWQLGLGMREVWWELETQPWAWSQ